MLFSAVLVAALAASATALRTPPPTERGEKCSVPDHFGPLGCPEGYFCPQGARTNLFCYKQLSLGQPCYGDTNDCAEPNYCRRDLRKPEEPGACTARAAEGGACGGFFAETCAGELQCLTPDGLFVSSGKCVAIPRPVGEACNFDWHCHEGETYCHQNNQGVDLGVCKPLAKVGEACANHFNEPNLAPPCTPNLGCYIEGDEHAKGVCVEKDGGAGTKCSLSGGVFCKNDFFCLRKAGKDYGICVDVLKIGAKCSNAPGTVPCQLGLSCYAEDNPKDGVCQNQFNNPIGSKCNGFVRCADDAYCKMASGKKYGKCERALTVGEKCAQRAAGVVPCAQDLACYIEEDPKNGVCAKLWGNPIGAKCGNWNICATGAVCKTAEGKKYGKCVKSDKPPIIFQPM